MFTAVDRWHDRCLLCVLLCHTEYSAHLKMMVDKFLYHTINLTGIKSELGAGSKWGQV